MEKLGNFKTQDLTDKMKSMYCEFLNDVAMLQIENKKLSSRLAAAMRNNRFILAALVVSLSINVIAIAGMLL